MDYYNEKDPFMCQWLQELMDTKQINKGVIDARSIEDVIPHDLTGFTQCHFFAGLGGWPLAFKMAGWPARKPVWSGSCPCQPFSSAGQGKGFQDERHLWPAFEYLISECRPCTVMGEQVSGARALSWLDNVRLGLERRNYTFGSVGLCAASHWAPHIRKRLWWVGHTYGERLRKPELDFNRISRCLEKKAARYGKPSISPWVHYSPASVPVCNLDGLPKPMGIVRGFGNAIVPQVAAEFIHLAVEVLNL